MTRESAIGMISALCASSLGVFRGRDAIALGISRNQIGALNAAGVVERVLPDTYRMTAVARSHEQSLRAALLWAGPDAAATGRSAAALLRIERVQASKAEIVVRRHAAACTPRARARPADTCTQHVVSRVTVCCRTGNGSPHDPSYHHDVCGIGGCVVWGDRRPDVARLEAMRDAMSHRGPDSQGLSVIENVGLVHTRLAIVDLAERSNQPMSTPDGRSWLAYNGEIFNHLALRNDVPFPSFSTTSDTETLLHLLNAQGDSAIPSLNGQFAFAFLDMRLRRLLLARDRFGIKPLYLSQQDDCLWFASEPEALVAAGIAPTPRPDAWERIVAGSFYPGPETLHRNIESLPPGGLLSVDLDAPIATRRIWGTAAELVDRDRQDELARRSRAELTDELEATLRSAVRDSLMGDVPVGTLCSGGLDSSLVTALACETSPHLVAFSARYRGDPEFDEGPAAERVAHALGIELDTLEITESGWRSGLVDATLHFGGPLANASSVTIAQMADRARARGIRVLLTGEGADELFGGYVGHHADALAAVLSSRARAVHVLEPVVFGSPGRAIVSLAQRVLTRLSRRSPGGAIGETHRDGAVDEDGDGDGDMVSDAYAHHSGPARRLETDLIESLDDTLSYLLNRMDKNMMQVSVEARVPLLDPRVACLALNLPLAARTGPWTKGILRDVARRHLPLRIAHRPKMYGMDFDAGVWIERAAPAAFLSRGVLCDQLHLTREEFQRVLESASGALRLRLWSAEIWARHILADESPASIERSLWPHGH